MIYELRQTLAKQEELQDQFNQLLSENQQLRTVYHEADTAYTPLFSLPAPLSHSLCLSIQQSGQPAARPDLLFYFFGEGRRRAI